LDANFSNLKFDPALWLTADPGYWKIPWAKDIEKMIVPCLHKQRCLAGGKCIEHAEGPMCGACEEGFYPSGQTCAKCESKTQAARILVVMGIVLAVFSILFALRKKLKKYRSAWRDVLRVVKIQVDFWQVNSGMPMVMPVQFPAAWLDFMANFEVLNFDLGTLLGFGCITGFTFTHKFIIISLAPIVVFLIGWGKYQRRRVLHTMKKKMKEAKNSVKGMNRAKGQVSAGVGGKAQQVPSKTTNPNEKSINHEDFKEGLRVAFNIADADNSGFIDVHEFAELVRTLGHKKFQDKHAQKLFQKKCKDGDYFLDMEEFFTIVLDKKNKVHIDTEVIAWSKARRDMYQSIADVCQLLLLVHTPVSRDMFQYFNCQKLDDRAYLKMDMNVRCEGQDYVAGSVYAVIYGFVFVLGFPVILSSFLFRHRNELYAVRVTDKIGFLYDRFIKGAEFWELHELMRKMFLAGFSVFLSGSPQFQVMMSALVSVFAQINLNYFKPHRNKVVFSIAEICFTGITLKYLIALLMTGMESGEEDPAMATYMIVIDLGVTISGVLGMVMAFFVLYRKMRAVERNLKKKQRTGSTKVGPKISEDEAAHVLLMERQNLHDQIMSSSAKMELKTQGERQLHEHLLELMRIEKDVFNLLDESQKNVTKLETKLHVQAHRALAAGGGKVPTHDVHLLHDEMIALRSAQVSRLNHGAHSIDTLLSKMFHTFDTESIGRLGPPQLKALFLELMRENATYEDLKAGIDAEHVIAAVDQDKNGAIEEKEFVMWIKRGIAQT
jgi:Ca2+-binding EF-hand superfamily protein